VSNCITYKDGQIPHKLQQGLQNLPGSPHPSPFPRTWANGSYVVGPVLEWISTKGHQLASCTDYCTSLLHDGQFQINHLSVSKHCV